MFLIPCLSGIWMIYLSLVKDKGQTILLGWKKIISLIVGIVLILYSTFNFFTTFSFMYM